MTEGSGRKRRRAIVAAAIGNLLEWYDFAVYGFMATVLAGRFFPAENDAVSLLATFAAFGVGFAARPLGAILIGRLADRRGRKTALMVTISLMAIGTVAIGLAPDYRTIGVWAPALIVFARLIQGFSAGGEWGSSTAFMVEWADQGRRGLVGSFQQVSVAGGLLMGSGCAALVGTILTDDAVAEWGWRIPFLLGGAIGLVALYMRRHVDETPAYRRVVAGDRVMAADRVAAVGGHPLKAAARAFGFTIHWTVSYYIFLAYMPTFAERHLGLDRTVALWSNSLGLLVLVLTVPLAGLLSDRIGRKPLLLASCIGFAVLAYPLFDHMLGGTSIGAIMAAQVLFGLLIALYSGPGPAAIAEMFATLGRATWMSVGYSLAVAIFGGFAPFVSTWLIAATGSALAPVFYVLAAAAVTALVILTMPETARRRLD
ncbi:MAG: MFS transporter [Alphaproteobacteria bacterium]|jgi:MHS family proline/betaine transporter-like MFS transporter|nr:MFS transporter [Alphaproteobacteria bacterium]